MIFVRKFTDVTDKIFRKPVLTLFFVCVSFVKNSDWRPSLLKVGHVFPAVFLILMLMGALT